MNEQTAITMAEPRTQRWTVSARHGLSLAPWLAAMLLFAACKGDPPPLTDGGIIDGGTGDGRMDGPPAVNQVAPGIIGRFSALAAQGGTLLASAYESTYGDLVLVSAPAANPEQQTREFVDGVPKVAPTKDPKGYRGGIDDPGDDVGQDTDIVVGAGTPMIVYRDVTNRSLKLAVKAASGWSTHTIQAPQGGKEIVGRYASLSLVGGKPALAYLVLNIDAGSGTFKSELRWAQAAQSAPAAASDWSIATIESSPMPCRNLCEPSEVCALATTGTSACVTKGSGCGTCGTNEGCVGGACTPILPSTQHEDVPAASGLWASAVLTSGGPVVVYYDSINGRLKAAAQAGDGSWSTAVIGGTGSADVGAFCSTAVDKADTVHVAYQDAAKRTLHYAQLDPKALKVTISEIIDDGKRPDGLHPVGADSAIFVDASGGIGVVYQDSQTANLLGAKRSGPGSWTPKNSSDADLGRLVKGGTRAYGFYTDVVLDGGKVFASSFYYEPKATPKGGLELFALP